MIESISLKVSCTFSKLLRLYDKSISGIALPEKARGWTRQEIKKRFLRKYL